MGSLPTISEVINAVMDQFLLFVGLSVMMSFLITPMLGVPLAVLGVWGKQYRGWN